MIENHPHNYAKTHHAMPRNGLLGNETLPALSDDIRSTTLITRHTGEEAQAQAQILILLAEDNLVN